MGLDSGLSSIKINGIALSKKIKSIELNEKKNVYENHHLKSTKINTKKAVQAVRSYGYHTKRKRNSIPGIDQNSTRSWRQRGGYVRLPLSPSSSATSTPIALMKSFISLSVPEAFKYGVFLSFAGMDARKGFITFLYYALTELGVRTFMDDRVLRVGDRLTVELPKAIEMSRIFLIVLSEHYPSSAFCREEFVHMLHESAKGNGRRILMVFYNSSPSDVLRQMRRELDLHKNSVKPESLGKWTKALEILDAANFSIWQLQV